MVKPIFRKQFETYKPLKKESNASASTPSADGTKSARRPKLVKLGQIKRHLKSLRLTKTAKTEKLSSIQTAPAKTFEKEDFKDFLGDALTKFGYQLNPYGATPRGDNNFFRDIWENFQTFDNGAYLKQALESGNPKGVVETYVENSLTYLSGTKGGTMRPIITLLPPPKTLSPTETLATKTVQSALGSLKLVRGSGGGNEGYLQGPLEERLNTALKQVSADHYDQVILDFKANIKTYAQEEAQKILTDHVKGHEYMDVLIKNLR